MSRAIQWLVPLCGLGLMHAASANTPCLGAKGGVHHCASGRFVCNDGSVSASKRICGGGDANAASFLAPPAASAASGGCPCGTGTFCTGPHGGRYCLTPSGRKRYIPRD
jgi:hypothetical protein